MKRLILLLPLLVMSLCACTQRLTILHMNDTHSQIEPQRSGKHAGRGGVIEQAAYIDSVRLADGKSNVLLMHAGDFSQGSSYFTEFDGDIEVEIINAMGFDVVCLGNHEFDNGLDELSRRLKNLKTPVVCANYDFTRTPLNGLVSPYVIIEKAGRKIGVIGLLTDLSVVVSAEIAAMLKFHQPVPIANDLALRLKKEGCDLIIALTHLGYEDEPYTDIELAEASRNIDVVVGGHSHTCLDDMGVVRNMDGREVIVVTDGKWGLDVGKLTVK